MKTKYPIFLIPIFLAGFLVVSSLVFSTQVQAQMAETQAAGSTFTVKQITNNTVEDTLPALAIDSSGFLHVAYESNDNIIYLTNASGSWVDTIIAGEPIREFNPSIAVDRFDHVHISYFSGDSGPNYDLYYTSNAPDGNWGGSYVTTIIDMNSSHSWGGIAVDGAGNPYIVYDTYDGTNVQVEICYQNGTQVHGPSADWLSQPITEPGSYGEDPTIAVESDGTVHIAYESINLATFCREISSATNASGSWVRTIIEKQGPIMSANHPSIAVDAASRVYIAYEHWLNMTEATLEYASNLSGAWITETISTAADLGSWQVQPSIAIDNGGKVHIASLSYWGTNITHATNASGTWETTEIPTNAGWLTYLDRAIAIDGSGYVHIVYNASDDDDEIYHAKSDQSFYGACAAPRAIACGEQVTGNTAGLGNTISSYGCSPWDESGPEEIWAFTLAPGNTYSVTAQLLGFSAELDIFLMSPAGCAAGTCLGPNSYGDRAARANHLSGGNTFYIAVDGREGVQGSYTMRLLCETVPNRIFLPMLVR